MPLTFISILADDDHNNSNKENVANSAQGPVTPCTDLNNDLLNRVDDSSKPDPQLTKESSSDPLKLPTPVVDLTRQAESTVEGVTLDKELEYVLGEDPTNPKKKVVNVHPSLVPRWSTWLAEGLPEDMKKELIDKYPLDSNMRFEAPELNEEVVSVLNEVGTKRDQLIVAEQNLAGSALSALGEAITMILNDEEEPVDQLELLEKLSDGGQLLSQLHFQVSSARKSFIAPALSKQMKELLQKTKPGTLLYGERLSDKIKTAKSVEKIGRELKTPSSATSSFTAKKPIHKPAYGRPLNWRGQYAKPGTQHQGQKFPQTNYPRLGHYSNKKTPSSSSNQPRFNRWPQGDKKK